MAYVFDLKVIPQSGRQRCLLDKSGMLKCYLKNAAESNKANEELCTFLAKSLKMPKSSVSILLGTTSRKKKIKIEGAIDQNILYAALEIDVQMKF